VNQFTPITIEAIRTKEDKNDRNTTTYSIEKK